MGADDEGLISGAVIPAEARLAACAQLVLLGPLHKKEGRKIYMYALTKPHGSCRGSGGSDMHKQIKHQNRDKKLVEYAGI